MLGGSACRRSSRQSSLGLRVSGGTGLPATQARAAVMTAALAPDRRAAFLPCRTVGGVTRARGADRRPRGCPRSRGWGHPRARGGPPRGGRSSASRGVTRARGADSVPDIAAETAEGSPARARGGRTSARAARRRSRVTRARAGRTDRAAMIYGSGRVTRARGADRSTAPAKCSPRGSPARARGGPRDHPIPTTSAGVTRARGADWGSEGALLRARGSSPFQLPHCGR